MRKSLEDSELRYVSSIVGFDSFSKSSNARERAQVYVAGSSRTLSIAYDSPREDRVSIAISNANARGKSLVQVTTVPTHSAGPARSAARAYFHIVANIPSRTEGDSSARLAVRSKARARDLDMKKSAVLKRALRSGLVYTTRTLKSNKSTKKSCLCAKKGSEERRGRRSPPRGTRGQFGTRRTSYRGPPRRRAGGGRPCVSKPRGALARRSASLSRRFRAKRVPRASSRA